MKNEPGLVCKEDKFSDFISFLLAKDKVVKSLVESGNHEAAERVRSSSVYIEIDGTPTRIGTVRGLMSRSIRSLELLHNAVTDRRINPENGAVLRPVED